MVKKGIDMDPQGCGGYLELADIYMIQERYEEAENVLKKVIENEPNDEPAYTALGLCYRLQCKN